MGQSMGGPAAGSVPGGQPLLPSIHETDMSIQADSRVMRMTVGALPNSSSAHAQVNAVPGRRGGSESTLYFVCVLWFSWFCIWCP